MDSDVRVRLSPEGDGFVATLEGVEGHPIAFALPVPVAQIDTVLAGTEEAVLRTAGVATRGERERKPVSPVAPDVLGRTLFDSLFGGAIRARVEAPGTIDAPRRIIVQIDPNDRRMAPLLRLPWELACAPDTGEYLSLSETTTLFRYMDVGHADTPASVMLPLRVLAVLSSPSDEAPLDLATERRKIEASWGMCSGVEVEFLEEATRSALEKRLVERSYQVLHYMGHGAFNDATGEGALVMEDDAGKRMLVSGTELAGIVASAETLQLVYLNACNTAQSSEDASHNVFAGVAAALSATGAVPAVLAMQFSISDRAAIVFAEHFYKAIVDEQPADVAVAGARRALVEAHPGTLEWVTPVLYMRSLSGRLFDFLSIYG
ncbi:MAG: CHAT domain-containing protein [Rhodothermales bacterium]|nr:CHAT domain-containing protein [Rhodothermales bacterium]